MPNTGNRQALDLGNESAGFWKFGGAGFWKDWREGGLSWLVNAVVVEGAGEVGAAVAAAPAGGSK